MKNVLFRMDLGERKLIERKYEDTFMRKYDFVLNLSNNFTNDHLSGNDLGKLQKHILELFLQDKDPNYLKWKDQIHKSFPRTDWVITEQRELSVKPIYWSFCKSVERVLFIKLDWIILKES